MIVCVAGVLLERTELVEASPQNSGEANEINSMSLTVQPGERQRYFTRSRRSVEYILFYVCFGYEVDPASNCLAFACAKSLEL